MGYFDFGLIHGFLPAKRPVFGNFFYSELWITRAATPSNAVMAW